MRALFLLLAGCLSVPDTAQPMCASNDDCSSGTVCYQQVCYGDPPTGTYAAVLSPPSDRVDLAQVEMPAIALPGNGDLGALALEAPGAFAGTLQAICPRPADCVTNTPLGATITITHPSAIANGLPFRAAITTSSASFQVAVPHGDDYTVLIMPAGRGDSPAGGVTAAQIVPPLRLTGVKIGGDHETTALSLGGLDLATIDGTLTDANKFALPSYRVVAMGKWDENSDASEVSTVAYTASDGKFHLVLAKGVVGYLEIVAKPYGGLGPTFHLGNLAVESQERTLSMPSGAGSDKTVDLHITALDGSGKTVDVSGARVTLGASAKVSLGSYVSVSATDTTDNSGHVKLHVLDGELFAQSYQLQIVPPASSTFGAVFGQSIALDAKDVVLPSRVSIRGKVVDATGAALSGVSVTARPALNFTWNLQGDAQAFLGEIPAAITTTGTGGEFVVWVDPLIAGVFGHYDLSFEPSQIGVVAQYSTTVDMPRDSSTSVALDTLQIPAAAYLHADLVDRMGNPVEGAEIKLYQVGANMDVCDLVAYPPAGCPVPAPLVARGTADTAGEARLAVGRP